MKITVKVETLITDIEEAVIDYGNKYDKLLILYRKKIEEYIIYLDKIINSDEDLSTLKSPPYAPTWLRDNFVSALAALRAHQNDTVEMDDKEYSSIINGLERLNESITSSTASFNLLSY